MDRISGAMLFAVGAGILWHARKLRTGSFSNPGPGLFPLLIAVVLIVLSIPLIVAPRKGEEKLPFSFSSTKRVVVVYASLLGYFFTLQYLGFPLAGFLLMVFLFVVIDRQNLKRATLTALVFMILAYLLFNVALKGQLPKGVIGI